MLAALSQQHILTGHTYLQLRPVIIYIISIFIITCLKTAGQMGEIKPKFLKQFIIAELLTEYQDSAVKPAHSNSLVM
jgi:hypothetical protein